jgi:RNA polymerase sigma factor (sigma-70 family)
MKNARLETLLEQWSRGDSAAAEKALVSCGPSLRTLIRRQMSPRFRSTFPTEEIVQSVWTELMSRLRQAVCRFRDVDHLQTFLIKLARNLLAHRLRQHRAAVAAECQVVGDGQDGPGARRGPRPDEVAPPNDPWDRILALCPPAHRAVVELKRQGLSLAEIASRTGMNESHVRLALYDVASRITAGTPT